MLRLALGAFVDDVKAACHRGAAVVVPQSGVYVNRFELANAMFNRTPIHVGGVECIVNGITAEDGSGHNFNVTLLVGQHTHVVYMRG